MEQFFQQIHAKDDGEIVVVSSGRHIALVCKNCRCRWDFDIPFLGVEVPHKIPEEWKSYVPD